MAIAPAAGEAPALGALAIGLVFLVSFLVTAGILWSYKHTIGYVLERLAGVLDYDYWRVHIHFGGAIRSLDNGIQHALGRAASFSSDRAGRFFHEFAVLNLWIGNELLSLAADTYGFSRWLVTAHLPRWARLIRAGILGPAVLTALIAREVAKRLHNVHTVTKVIVASSGAAAIAKLYRPLAARVTTLEHRVAAIAAAAAAAGAGTLDHVLPFPRVHWPDWSRWSGISAKQLRRLARLLTPAGAAALVAVAVAELGIGYVRCKNVKRTGRLLCRTPPRILEELLAGGLDALVVADICRLVPLIERAAIVFEPVLDELVNLEAFVCLAGGASLPSGMTAAESRMRVGSVPKLPTGLTSDERAFALG